MSKLKKVWPFIIIFAVPLILGALSFLMPAHEPPAPERSASERQVSAGETEDEYMDESDDPEENVKEDIVRADDWRQFVHDSPFKLGEVSAYYDTYYEDDFDPEVDYGEGYEHIAVEASYMQDLATYPYIDGSTVCIPMAAEFARQHLGFNDENALGMSALNTTAYAYENLITRIPYSSTELSYSRDDGEYIGVSTGGRPVDIVLGTEPSQDELSFAQRCETMLYKEPICSDAFVFITNKENPVDSLTLEQVRDIYAGKITNWSDVGGEDREIVAYQREKNSGSQTAMENLVMRGAKLAAPPRSQEVSEMGGLIVRVSSYKDAKASIGYTYKYYLDELYKSDDVKIVSIDGIAPTDENIANKQYPFSTNYYGVIRAEDRDKTGGKFLEWIVSDEGQKCIKQAGYTPVKNVSLDN